MLRDMIPLVANGQLDVATGGPNASLFNAVARNISLRLVADKATTSEKYSALAVVVRSDLLDAGALRTPADLRGKIIAVPGNYIDYGLDTTLRRAGLDPAKDVQSTTLGFPEVNVAMSNRAIDAGIQVEPALTLGEKQGLFRPLIWDNDMIPNHSSAIMLFAPNLVVERNEVGKRFMVAYVQGIRDYYDAFITGRKPRSELIPTMIAHTPIKDPALWEQLRVADVDPDGYANRASLEGELKWNVEHGMVADGLDLATVIDDQFADYAVQQLGKYPR